MTAHEKGRDLIERYLYKVGEELPKKQRDDVKAELRSLLEDAIEERASAGRSYDEDLAAEVLREFGKPETVAERYRPTGQYLIGPRLYPVFIDVAKIVLIVLACFYVGVVGLSLLTSSARLPELFQPDSLWGFFESFAKVAFVNLAILTVVFALIERYGDTRPASGKEEWDPRKLPAVPIKADPDRISTADRVFKIYAIIALFIWVNEFPDTLGIWFFTGDQTRVLRFSDMGLHLPVLLLNVFWALALGLNMWLLKLGRWTRETRWAEFGLGLFGTAIFYMVLVSSLFVGAESTALAEANNLRPLALLEAARADLPRWGRFLHGILTWFLAFSLIEAAIRLFRIFRRYPVW
jgi:hypothetical protein